MGDERWVFMHVRERERERMVVNGWGRREGCACMREREI